MKVEFQTTSITSEIATQEDKRKKMFEDSGPSQEGKIPKSNGDR